MKAIVHCLKNAPMPPQNITDFFVTLIEDGNYFHPNFLWACERDNLEFGDLGGTRNVISGVGTDSIDLDGDTGLDDDNEENDDDMDEEVILSPDELGDVVTMSMSGKLLIPPNNSDTMETDKDKEVPNNDPSNNITSKRPSKETLPSAAEGSVNALSALPGQPNQGIGPTPAGGVGAAGTGVGAVSGAAVTGSGSGVGVGAVVGAVAMSSKSNKQQPITPQPLNPKNIVTLPSQPDIPLDIGRARMLLQVQ